MYIYIYIYIYIIYIYIYIYTYIYNSLTNLYLYYLIMKSNILQLLKDRKN